MLSKEIGLMKKSIGACVFFIFTFMAFGSLYSQPCLTIESILVDACAPPANFYWEGLNEMFRFRVGNQPVNAAQMQITWANNIQIIPFNGFIQNAQTANLTAQINATVQSCGRVIEPPGLILPANKKVIVITSQLLDVNANPFSALTDTLYILYHNHAGPVFDPQFGTTVAYGHFINFNPNPVVPSIQTLRVRVNSIGCDVSVSYNQRQLVTQAGNIGAQDGASVSFNAAGSPTYFNNGCVAPVTVLSAAWTLPPPLCANAATINLSTNITGTPGGTWSGQGVSANGQFNPQGLSGSIPVTYTVGQGACSKFLTQNITITQPSNASWTVPSALCANSPAINLNTNVTGTSGGTWTGQGVSSNGQFNPQGLSGSIAITYSVGSGACAAVSTQNITVIQNANAAWTVPPPLCSNASAINLNVNVTGTSGGGWSGQGVSSDGQFNPQGLSGSIAITYTVGTGSCAATSTQNITVIPSADAAWTVPSPLCANSPAIDLNTNVTGTSGGTWSGQGVSSSGLFNPQGLSGSIAITYSVGSGACAAASTQSITIIQNASATWNPPPSVCIGSSAINLNTNVTGTSGGTWSGQGVSAAGQFNPQGLSGAIAITYTVGTGSCAATSTQNITVIPSADAAWTVPSPLCANSPAINLTGNITGTSGGTWTGQGVNAAGLFNPSGLSGLISITYSVGIGDCSANTQQDILVKPLPPAPLTSGNATYCAGETIEPITANGLSGAIFNWYSDSGLNNLIFTGSPYAANSNIKDLWVTQTLDGCEGPASFVTIIINAVPPPPPVQNRFIYCLGQSFPSLSVNAAPAAVVNWYSDSGLNNIIFTGNPYQPANNLFNEFWITQTINNCTSEPSFTSIVADSILVDFTVSDSIGVYPFFIELNNLSQNSANCFWYVNNQIKEEFSSDSYTFEEKGIYKITLSCISANGCKSEKTIKITVLPPETTIYIPNTFTPNEDRTNDLFQVYGEGIDEYFLQIFNRWGELIYQSNEIAKGWDGKVARTEVIAPQDVYVYKIFIQDILERSSTFYGRITLIK